MRSCLNLSVNYGLIFVELRIFFYIYQQELV